MSDEILKQALRQLSSNPPERREEILAELLKSAEREWKRRPPNSQVIESDSVGSGLYRAALSQSLMREVSLRKDVQSVRTKVFRRVCDYLAISSSELARRFGKPEKFTFPELTECSTPSGFVPGFLAEAATRDSQGACAGKPPIKLMRMEPVCERLETYFVPQSSFFVELDRTAEALATVTGWDKPFAVAAIFGAESFFPAISVASAYVERNLELPALTRIKLSIDPRCSPEDVRRLYRQARQMAKGEAPNSKKRNREFNDSTLAGLSWAGDPEFRARASRRFGLPTAVDASVSKRLLRFHRKLHTPTYRSNPYVNEASCRGLVMRRIEALVAEWLKDQGQSLSDHLSFSRQNLFGLDMTLCLAYVWLFDAGDYDDPTGELARAVSEHDDVAFERLSASWPLLRAFRIHDDWYQSACLFLDELADAGERMLAIGRDIDPGVVEAARELEKETTIEIERLLNSRAEQLSPGQPQKRKSRKRPPASK